MDVRDAKKTELLRTMLLIRHFELGAEVQHKLGNIPGAVHFYIGEEATAAGVCATLRPDDFLFSTHRGHGHCIAKGAEPRRIMAELFGKVTGYSRGRGGSMHIFAKELGILGTNGIVGGGLTLAAGAAFHAKLQKTGQVAACFFGDGAANNGTFHEAINLAGVLRLPVVFVCENNLYATETAVSAATLTRNFADRAPGYGIPGEVMDGNNVLDVFEKAARAVERARGGDGPTILESKTYRTCGHYAGHAEGGYRSREELEAWRARDPIRLFSRHLMDEGVLDQAALARMEEEAEAAVQEAVRFASGSPFPAPEEALEHVAV
jgi:pyruvate dehydrogenase E1 component alpha subunit